ncbi:hypothetical protein AB1I77_25570 [Bacillus paranthracis]|nr:MULTISPECIES: hypothetical protein [Bacillus cereus group]MCU5514756.1 hypothetical protein [Bacillus wiedmannii]MCU5722223.1 hypothetical protein [Bacillus cereus]
MSQLQGIGLFIAFLFAAGLFIGFMTKGGERNAQKGEKDDQNN